MNSVNINLRRKRLSLNNDSRKSYLFSLYVCKFTCSVSGSLVRFNERQDGTGWWWKGLIQVVVNDSSDVCFFLETETVW